LYGKYSVCRAPACRHCIGLPAFFFLAACHDDAPTEPSGTRVGPAGGNFVFADGAVSLVVPPGAVSQDVTVNVDPASGYPDSWTVVDGTVYSFAPEGIEFDLPVQLIIKYDPGRWPSRVEAQDLAIYEANDAFWQPVGDSEVDEADNTVSTIIDGFSVMGVLGVPADVTGRIATPDQLMKVGQSVTFHAAVEDSSDAWVPGSVGWSASRSDVISIDEVGADSCVVTALAPGETDLVAILDAVFVDQFVDRANIRTARPDDIEPGTERWRLALPFGGPGSSSAPALDGSDRIYVLAGVQTLLAIDGDGNLLFREWTCSSTLTMPAVAVDGRAHVAGHSCTQRHALDGSIEWMVPTGDTDAAPAVGPDGSVAVLWADGEDAVMLSRISSQGIELWRDTLFLERITQWTAPAIASNGDIYAQVKGPEYGGFLWRVGTNGSIRWMRELRGRELYTGPALITDRVVIADYEGYAAFDSAGTLLWQIDIAASKSPPVIDADGNIFFQTFTGLASYDITGNQRWATDSVWANAAEYDHISAPTLLSDDNLLVKCSRQRGTAINELCGVRRLDGGLVWRTDFGGYIEGSPAVAHDGTIYLFYRETWGGGQVYLLALWGDSPPLTEGWPTEGGGMGRLRRQQP
jgi:outer membrane protein assembly factor BamB